MIGEHFPKDKPIQFWTRTFCDYITWENYDGRRIDLLHPSMYWDNQPSKYNTIVHPDPYLFVNNDGYSIYMQRCTENHRLDWEKKYEVVYFQGALTGATKDKNGEPIGRYKLLRMSMDHP